MRHKKQKDLKQQQIYVIINYVQDVKIVIIIKINNIFYKHFIIQVNNLLDHINHFCKIKGLYLI